MIHRGAAHPPVVGVGSETRLLMDEERAAGQIAAQLIVADAGVAGAVHVHRVVHHQGFVTAEVPVLQAM